jgi:hypothetical protein
VGGGEVGLGGSWGGGRPEDGAQWEDGWAAMVATVQIFVREAGRAVYYFCR